MLHKLIESQVERMFRGYEVLARAPFRVTRNSNLYLQEEESRSVLESVRAELHNRRKGDAVRMEIENSAAEEIVERLRTNFELEPVQVFRTKGPVNLLRLMNLYGEVARPDLKFAGFHGRKVHLSPKSANLFDELRTQGHSAAPSVRLLRDGGGVCRVGGRGPGGGLDGADALSHQRGVAAVHGADRGRADQGSHGGGRADGALRRGLEHPLGARDGGRGRGRLPRHSRPEDALQAGADGAPRSRRRGAAIRAPGHRQLQLGDGALLHRHQPADVAAGDYLRGADGLPLPDGEGRVRETTRRCWWRR